jgi:hypothetical protein
VLLSKKQGDWPFSYNSFAVLLTQFFMRKIEAKSQRLYFALIDSVSHLMRSQTLVPTSQALYATFIGAKVSYEQDRDKF